MNNMNVKGFTKDAVRKLEINEWKGNVRELENAIERAVVLSTSDYIQAEDLPSSDDFSQEEKSDLNFVESSKTMTLDELSKKYIRLVFDKNNGAKEQTAKDLGIDRKTLYRKLKEMNIN